MQKQLSPDAATVATLPSKPKRTTTLPRKDTDFMDVAKTISASWTADPAVTLSWCKPADFETMVQSYSAELSERLSTGSSRPSQTQQLVKLDESANEAVKEVKVYIQKKYKKANAEAQYARFGIGKQGTSFKLPADRNKRLEALKLMCAAIDADGFSNEEYGKTFWNDLRSAYATALQTANATDGAVSGKVAGKNDKKDAIKKVMLALRRVIEGNYPDTYPAVFRKWGWQKEDY